MIKALIFDLDGTLVQTEVLKAESYAKAAVELNPSLKEEDVVEGFKDFVGLSRKEVAKGLLNKFDLGDAASKRMKDFDVAKPWQAFGDI
ncbi:MAG: HAD hydrolase-like protein, partial [Thermodesulfobacteriales bacterium]